MIDNTITAADLDAQRAELEARISAQYEATMAANLAKFEIDLRNAMAKALWPHPDRPLPGSEEAP